MATLTATQGFKAFKKQINDRTDAVRKGALIDMMQTANKDREGGGGLLPKDTGYLQSSLSGGAEGSEVFGADVFESAIRAAPQDVSLIAGWEAFYAKFQEFGTNKIAPAMFLRTETAQWDRYVQENVAKVVANDG